MWARAPTAGRGPRRGERGVVDGRVEADVEQLLPRRGVLQRYDDRLDQVVGMDEAAQERRPVGVEEQREGAARGMARRRVLPDHVAPARLAEHVLAEAVGGAEVVLLP